MALLSIVSERGLIQQHTAASQLQSKRVNR